MIFKKRNLLFFQDQIIYHLGAWITFITYEVSFVQLIRWTASNPPVISSYVIPYFFNIGLFYFHSCVTMNVGFEKPSKKRIRFFALLIIELALYLILMGLKDFNFTLSKFSLFSDLYSSQIAFIQQLWRGIYFLIFSSAFWLIQKSFKKEKELKEVEKKMLLERHEKQAIEIKLISIQNAFLQSQISPHLLFNTLNFIHSEVQEISSKASDAVITLADMMRYSLAEASSDGKVSLEREIEQINNLIIINQFRFNQQLCVKVQTEGDFTTVRITPLLLLPFVENVFKYADMAISSAPALISIKLEHAVLFFSTSNLKRRTNHFPSSGIGIKNVKTRLDYAYANSHSLIINDTGTSFSITLNIKL